MSDSVALGLWSVSAGFVGLGSDVPHPEGEGNLKTTNDRGPKLILNGNHPFIPTSGIFN